MPPFGTSSTITPFVSYPDDNGSSTPTVGGSGDASSASADTTGTGSAPSGGTPATYQPGYDPNNPTPYQALPLPQTTQPIPNPLPQQDEPSQQELGAARTAGAAAYMGNQILRGYMQGKAVRDARNAIQVQKQSTGLQSIYSDAAQQLHTMAAAGVDPNSPEFQKAKDHVDASWNSLMDFYGQHVEKPGKGKNGQQSVMQKLQSAFQSQDPAQVSSAVYEGLKITGPPVLHQIAPMLTPAYQAKVQQRAQTAGTVAETAQKTAANQKELQDLLSDPNQTPEKQDRIMQIKYGISKGTTLPPTMTWKSLPGAQIYQGNDGNYYKPEINGLGQTRQTQLDSSFVPSTTMLKGIPKTFQDKGVWYTYQVDQQGKALPNTVKPLSSAVAAGSVNTTSNVVKMVTQPDGSIVPVTVQNSSTRTHGGGGQAAPVAPGVTTTAPGAATAGATPGGTTTAMPAPSPAASTLPPTAPTGEQPVDTASVAPAAPPPAVSATPAATVHAPTPGTNGATPLTSHPAAPAISRPHVMSNGVVSIGAPIGGKLPGQELQSYHAMQDTAPVIKDVMKMLEPFKNDNGPLDGLDQRAKSMGYQQGFNTGALNTAIQQYTAFVRIAGAAPWSKVGRGQKIFSEIVQHLPDPSKDTPSLMYQKMADMQHIYAGQMAEMQDRVKDMSAGGQVPRSMQAATGTPGTAATSAAAAASAPVVKPAPPKDMQQPTYIKASDGYFHWVPGAKLGDARKIDPKLTVIP